MPFLKKTIKYKGVNYAKGTEIKESDEKFEFLSENNYLVDEQDTSQIQTTSHRISKDVEKERQNREKSKTTHRISDLPKVDPKTVDQPEETAGKEKKKKTTKKTSEPASNDVDDTNQDRSPEVQEAIEYIEKDG